MAYTPVIMITGHAAPQIREHARALGVAEFMVKPIDRDQLKSHVARLLGIPVAVTEPTAPTQQPVQAAAPSPASPVQPALADVSTASSSVASMLLDRVASILEDIDALRAGGAPPDAQRLATSLGHIEDACGEMTRLIIQLNEHQDRAG
jgi:CheY-like chemotaxis protein